MYNAVLIMRYPASRHTIESIQYILASHSFYFYSKAQASSGEATPSPALLPLIKRLMGFRIDIIPSNIQ